MSEMILRTKHEVVGLLNVNQPGERSLQENNPALAVSVRRQTLWKTEFSRTVELSRTLIPLLAASPPSLIRTRTDLNRQAERYFPGDEWAYPQTVGTMMLLGRWWMRRGCPQIWWEWSSSSGVSSWPCRLSLRSEVGHNLTIIHLLVNILGLFSTKYKN